MSASNEPACASACFSRRRPRCCSAVSLGLATVGFGVGGFAMVGLCACASRLEQLRRTSAPTRTICDGRAIGRVSSITNESGLRLESRLLLLILSVLRNGFLGVLDGLMKLFDCGKRRWTKRVLCRVSPDSRVVERIIDSAPIDLERI